MFFMCDSIVPAMDFIFLFWLSHETVILLLFFAIFISFLKSGDEKSFSIFPRPPLTETLKWGQPSYLTEATKSGTTVRIDRVKKGDGYALYVHCQSGLVPKFRDLYGDTFRYEGKRALLFETDARLPMPELRHCIALALTHHLRAK